MHVDEGSTINLTCVSKFAPAAPPDVVWYHENEVKCPFRSSLTKKRASHFSNFYHFLSISRSSK